MTKPSNSPSPAPASPAPLSRERVLHAAMQLADAEGLEAVSMRKLAQALGVKAMSLYNHVANKDDILDSIEGRHDGIHDFEFGLELILDGLDQLRDPAVQEPPVLDLSAQEPPVQDWSNKVR